VKKITASIDNNDLFITFLSISPFLSCDQRCKPDLRRGLFPAVWSRRKLDIVFSRLNPEFFIRIEIENPLESKSVVFEKPYVRDLSDDGIM
jgi:hypothetical protein